VRRRPLRHRFGGSDGSSCDVSWEQTERVTKSRNAISMVHSNESIYFELFRYKTASIPVSNYSVFDPQVVNLCFEVDLLPAIVQLET